MNLGKATRIAKAVTSVTNSSDPGRTAGKLVRTAVTAAHPIAGAVGGKLIEEGTKKLVDKGIEIAKDPRTQALAKKAGNDAVRIARRGAGAARARVLEFKAGHKKNG